jgi:hypothetical protein
LTIGSLLLQKEYPDDGRSGALAFDISQSLGPVLHNKKAPAEQGPFAEFQMLVA